MRDFNRFKSASRREGVSYAAASGRPSPPKAHTQTLAPTTPQTTHSQTPPTKTTTPNPQHDREMAQMKQTLAERQNTIDSMMGTIKDLQQAVQNLAAQLKETRTTTHTDTNQIRAMIEEIITDRLNKPDTLLGTQEKNTSNKRHRGERDILLTDVELQALNGSNGNIAVRDDVLPEAARREYRALAREYAKNEKARAASEKQILQLLFEAGVVPNSQHPLGSQNVTMQHNE
ncbi:hypothetical protein DFQ26_009499 [Actinomortierella ambigua]|nr:hypothetical protein DFQ26_009499 [Actinomortierella ambigua]